jgi:hypothetical protein
MRSVFAFLAAAVGMLATHAAGAYPFWQWRVIGLYNSTGETFEVAGPSTTVTTKAEALSIMRSLAPPYSEHLTLDRGPSNVSTQEFVTYDFHGPTAPRTLTPWIYRPMGAAYVGESETEAEDALRNYWIDRCGTGTTVTANSDWITSLSNFWGPQIQSKSFVVSCSPFAVGISRQRDSTCPAGYPVNIYDGSHPMLCIIPYVGRIEGRLLECPSMVHRVTLAIPVMLSPVTSIKPRQTMSAQG